MAEMNIQMRHYNGKDWDSLFPRTKAAIVMMNDGTTVQAKVTQIINELANKATKADINNAIEQLVDNAPEALDTLHELAEALGNDPNFATTITNMLAQKVDKVSGKQLSTEDFTTALKNKLEGLPSSVYSKSEVNSLLNGKVDKVSGKGLSTNDFTDAYKNKLDGLPSDVYSKQEVDQLIGGKATTIVVSESEPSDSDMWFEVI